MRYRGTLGTSSNWSGMALLLATSIAVLVEVRSPLCTPFQPANVLPCLSGLATLSTR
jgi:hypothetical protein